MKVSTFALLVMLHALPFSCGVGYAKALPLRVSLYVECKNESDILVRGVVANDGPRPIQIENGALPWYLMMGTSEYSVSSMLNGREVPQSLYPVLGLTGPKIVNPGQHLAGHFPLNLYFQGAAEAIHKEGVIVRWRYWPGLSPKKAGEFYAGTIRIEKGSCDARHWWEF